MLIPCSAVVLRHIQLTKNMPKRITITLPEPIYKGLGEISKLRDKVPASLAAEAVEEAVRQAASEGKISPLEPPIKSSSDSAGLAAVSLIGLIAKGEKLTPSAIEQAAIDANVSPKALAEKLTNLSIDKGKEIRA